MYMYSNNIYALDVIFNAYNYFNAHFYFNAYLDSITVTPVDPADVFDQPSTSSTSQTEEPSPLPQLESTETPHPTDSTAAVTPPSSSQALIAGAVIGPVVLITVVALASFWLGRRSSNDQNTTSNGTETDEAPSQQHPKIQEITTPNEFGHTGMQPTAYHGSPSPPWPGHTGHHQSELPSPVAELQDHGQWGSIPVELAGTDAYPRAY
ncbi:hypothetical protein QBC38DRAFT_460407 [Podospora fimiseda]|uniref:Uncharacterized protein n=1 Tax=Podospora fimiseda TaxID=252190 RepID=A0AAN6YTG9_9PEZI|nr:hypothetical protein QBC38DRAFT_460407 [Podospora fimiseda]